MALMWRTGAWRRDINVILVSRCEQVRGYALHYKMPMEECRELAAYRRELTKHRKEFREEQLQKVSDMSCMYIFVYALRPFHDLCVASYKRRDQFFFHFFNDNVTK